MFETFAPPSRAARLRRSAIIPFAAVLALQAYDVSVPFFGRVPALLFVIIQLGTFGSAVAGIVAIRRGLRDADGAWSAGDALWLAGSIAVVLLCVFFFTRMTLPWLL